MKKSLLFSIIVILLVSSGYCQNGLIGDGFGTNDWSTTDNFVGSAGTSRIGTFTANGAGGRYFRLVTNWGGNYNQWGPNSTTNDYQITVGTAVPSDQIIQNSTTKAYFINASNTTDKYIFKTKEGGNPPTNKGLIVFRVEGDIRTVSSVIRDKSTVYRGQAVTVTASLDGSLSAGQGVYLRYTNNNFSSSSIIEMSGSGSTYSASIPSNINTIGATVYYYVFTSGSGLTISSEDADWYTINLNNNGGSNYSYSVDGSYITSNDGNWSTASNWADGIPPASASVIINHNLTLDQAATIGSMVINSGKTFTASDATPRTLTIAKSASGSSTTLANSGTWANGTGGSTVLFSGAPSSGDAIHAITGTIAFQNITINKTGGSSNVGASFGANSSVSGTLEIGAGGFVSTAPLTGFYGSNAILKFNQGTGANYNVGASDYTWSTTVIPNYITISSGTVNLSSPRTASGNLLIDGGALVLNAGLTIQGNWTRSSGTFTPNEETVTLSGATNTIINTATDATLYDMVVSKTGGAYVTLDNNLTVSHNLSISSGAILNVPSGKGLTVNGTLTNSAGNTGIVIKSDASGTGSLINSSTGVEATVERYISGAVEAWHLISSPVSGQEISGVWTPSGSYAGGWGYDFYAWDEPSATWLNQKVGANNITSFVPGKGYLVAFQAPNPTKTFTGTLNSGNITLPVTVSGSTTFGYANLAGNPYSSSIDWKNNIGFTRGMLKDDDENEGIGYSLYTWNQSENNYGAYISNSTSDEGTLGVSRYVSPMQGFFVVAASAGDFVINNNARVHSAQAWLKSGNDNSFRLKATAPANYGSDEILLEFGHESSNGGAEKWSSFVAEAPGIYTPKNGKNYSISFLNSVSENPVIPVSFTAGVQGNYTISADFNSDVFSQVSLRDNKTGDMQDMRINPVYSFSATPGDDANRFSLHFSSVGIDETSDLLAMNAYFHDGLLYISNTPSNAQITLSTLTGQVVMQRNTGGSGLVTLNAASLPKGVYIVTVQGEGARVSRKVVL